MKVVFFALFLALLSSPSWATLSTDEPQALREVRANQRDEEDLQAQKEMAQAAYQSLVVTVAGTAVSFVFGFGSIIFVYRSFRQTQKALAASQQTNRIAEQTAFVENRPWLYIENVRLDEHVIMPDKEGGNVLSVWVSFDIRNYGKMPAVDVCVVSALSSGQSATKWPALLAEAHAKERRAIVLPAARHVELAGVKCPISLRDTADELGFYKLTLGVSYRAQGSERTLVTAVNMALASSKDVQGRPFHLINASSLLVGDVEELYPAMERVIVVE